MEAYTLRVKTSREDLSFFTLISRISSDRYSEIVDPILAAFPVPLRKKILEGSCRPNNLINNIEKAYNNR